MQFEADEIHTFSVEDDTLDGAPYVNIAVNAKDQYGNDVNFDVQVEVSGFDDLTEPCSGSNTCTETSSPIKFETGALQDSGTAEFTETNSGMTDSLEITIERV
ncbi:hypothetical protein EL22_28360 [Halostagnicola sp. A56]|uniref:hypothetical protein n=1 Tax=Halostagnicola sp. A56 TaxID=1495067 RepID=UPI00065F6B0F|nr:hypothetical protein [Halostagnicola sp. A56]KMT45666.1 hypothetical protein EL22_28360 [Halostagnicola sp. A56]